MASLLRADPPQEPARPRAEPSHQPLPRTGPHQSAAGTRRAQSGAIAPKVASRPSVRGSPAGAPIGARCFGPAVRSVREPSRTDRGFGAKEHALSARTVHRPRSQAGEPRTDRSFGAEKHAPTREDGEARTGRAMGQGRAPPVRGRAMRRLAAGHLTPQQDLSVDGLCPLGGQTPNWPDSARLWRDSWHRPRSFLSPSAPFLARRVGGNAWDYSGQGGSALSWVAGGGVPRCTGWGALVCG